MHLSMLLPCGPYADFYVLSEGSKKFHEALDRKGARAIAHQSRHVRLPDAQDFPRLRLLQAALLDQPVNLQRQLGFQQFLLGVGKAEVGKNISATSLEVWFSYRDGLFGSTGHSSSAFRDAIDRPQPGAGE